MYSLLVLIHVLVSLMLIGIVLFQADEDAGLGGAFGTAMSGGGGGGSMFGKKGAAGVVTRFTAILVTIFMITSFILTWLVSKGHVSKKEITLNSTPVQVSQQILKA